MSVVQLQQDLFKLIQNIEDRVRKLEKLPIVENWHEIGTDGNPAFENSWTNYDTSTYNSVGFYKDPFGIIRLKGLAGGGSLNTNIFTLPVGFRPSKQHIFITQGDGGVSGRIFVMANGGVQPYGGPTTWQSLDGISFRSV